MLSPPTTTIPFGATSSGILKERDANVVPGRISMTPSSSSTRGAILTLQAPVSVAPDGSTHWGFSSLQAPASPVSPLSPLSPLAPFSPVAPFSPLDPSLPFDPGGP